MVTLPDILSLELGSDLILLLHNGNVKKFSKHINNLRQELTDELGFAVPKVKIIDNPALEPCEYNIKLKGIQKGKGKIPNDCLLCINYSSANLEVEGEETNDPIYEHPALWIKKDKKYEAQHIGYTVVEPMQIVTTHLREIIRQNITDIFSMKNTKKILDSVRKDYPSLVEDVLKEKTGLDIVDIYVILQSLLDENVSIRNIVAILKVISYYVPFSKKLWFIIEKCRQTLGSQICHKYADNNRILRVLTIDPVLEKKILNSKTETLSEINSALNPSDQKIWGNAVRKAAIEAIDKGWKPVILCSSEQMRRLVKDSLRQSIPNFGVLSIGEITPEIIIDCVGQIRPKTCGTSLENHKSKYTDSKSNENLTNGNLTIEEFYSSLESVFEKRKKSELTYKTLTNTLFALIEQNIHLNFCKNIKSYKLDESDLMLLLCFCYLFISHNDNNIGFNDLKVFYEDKISIHIIMSGLSEGKHILVKNRHIECNSFKDAYNSETWKLTQKTKKELFSKNCFDNSYGKQDNLIPFNSISDRKMIYNARESEAIVTLTSLLKEDNFQKIQTRLNAKGMRAGFTCLFSGSPGTGKTETAYQIARETRRNIMRVEISATKSMWLGESEKNIKSIFDTYRDAIEESEIAPILLLNEADAVIGRRIEFNSGNRAIDKTENRIQNIILEEMEIFSGILIATTNFVQNMDNAFERRFLYKIIFDKPTAENRKGIWNVLLPDLPEDITSKLSERYDLTGAQIENIARKMQVDSILSGSDFSMNTLMQYCNEESYNSFNTSKKIGFVSDMQKEISENV